MLPTTCPFAGTFAGAISCYDSVNLLPAGNGLTNLLELCFDLGPSAYGYHLVIGFGLIYDGMCPRHI
jgi:hypothetical protein